MESKPRDTLPERPLEGYDSHDGEALEYHGQCRLSSRHTPIQQSDSGYNKEDEAAQDDLVDIFEFPTPVLRVDVDLKRIASSRVVGLEGRLRRLWRIVSES